MIFSKNNQTNQLLDQDFLKYNVYNSSLYSQLRLHHWNHQPESPKRKVIFTKFLFFVPQNWIIYLNLNTSSWHCPKMNCDRQAIHSNHWRGINCLSLNLFYKDKNNFWNIFSNQSCLIFLKIQYNWKCLNHLSNN